MLTKMVVGFVFDSTLKRVLLIRKERPDWQKGYYNGIGCHVNDDERIVAAMQRKTKEEADLDIQNWHYVCNILCAERGGDMDVFVAMTDKIFKAEGKTDEWICVVKLNEVSSLHVIPNVKWLVPLARSVIQGKTQALTMCSIICERAL